MAQFLLYSGSLTTLLTLDDFFLLHDNLMPEYLGISGKLLGVGYGCLILLGTLRHHKSIRNTDYIVLLSALGFFGLSILVDSLQYLVEGVIGSWRVLLEDGFKLLGIAGWLGYYCRCGLTAIGHRITT